MTQRERYEQALKSQQALLKTNTHLVQVMGLAGAVSLAVAIYLLTRGEKFQALAGLGTLVYGGLMVLAALWLTSFAHVFSGMFDMLRDLHERLGERDGEASDYGGDEPPLPPPPSIG